MQDKHVRHLQHVSEPRSLHYPFRGHETICPINAVMEANGKKNIAVGVITCYAVLHSKKQPVDWCVRELTCLHALITRHLSVQDFDSFTSLGDMKLLGQFSQTQQQQQQFCSSIIWSLKRWYKKTNKQTWWSTFVAFDFATRRQKTNK